MSDGSLSSMQSQGDHAHSSPFLRPPGILLTVVFGAWGSVMEKMGIARFAKADL